MEEDELLIKVHYHEKKLATLREEIKSAEAGGSKAELEQLLLKYKKEKKKLQYTRMLLKKIRLTSEDFTDIGEQEKIRKRLEALNKEKRRLGDPEERALEIKFLERELQEFHERMQEADIIDENAEELFDDQDEKAALLEEIHKDGKETEFASDAGIVDEVDEVEESELLRRKAEAKPDETDEEEGAGKNNCKTDPLADVDKV